MPEASDSVHKPVLLNEVVEGLAPHEGIVYLDGTLGGAGHALAIAAAAKGRLTVVGLDRDPAAIARAEKLLLRKADKAILENEDFRNLDAVLAKHGIDAADAILLDLGISSDELENSGRGFSFKKDEPLLMTMNDPAKHPFTAMTIVNEWKEEDIANVIYGYGEERYARRFARAIVEKREESPIGTTGRLAEIIRAASPAMYRRGKIHPATRTFQALRIAVNDELGALREGLAKGWSALRPGGRMAIISFHSLEDRIVKESFRDKAKAGEGKLSSKKPIAASDEEIRTNPRSRSAKLRIIEKTKLS